MKNDFTYLKRFIPTFVISTLLWAFFQGFVLNFAKMLFNNAKAQCMLTWLVGTVLISAALASVSYRTGLDMNAGSTPVPMGIPVLNQIIGSVVYVAAFTVFGAKEITGPLTTMLSRAVLSNGAYIDFGVTIPRSNLIGFCIIQMLIFSIASLLPYGLAKRKQETKNDVVKKLRADRRSEDNV